MVHSINYGFYSGQMLVTQRQEVIVCITKEGKDLFFLNEKLEIYHPAEYCVQNCIFMYCC